LWLLREMRRADAPTPAELEQWRKEAEEASSTNSGAILNQQLEVVFGEFRGYLTTPLSNNRNLNQVHNPVIYFTELYHTLQNSITVKENVHAN